MSYNSDLPRIPPLPRNCPPGLKIWFARMIKRFFRGFESNILNFKER
jgi:hypothetical protein